MFVLGEFLWILPIDRAAVSTVSPSIIAPGNKNTLMGSENTGAAKEKQRKYLPFIWFL